MTYLWGTGYKTLVKRLGVQLTPKRKENIFSPLFHRNCPKTKPPLPLAWFMTGCSTIYAINKIVAAARNTNQKCFIYLLL